MIEANKLVKKTKKKFILFSIMGLAFVSTISYISVRLHLSSIERQSSVQALRSLITNQLNLINKISLLSEQFDKKKKVKNLIRMRYDLRQALDKLVLERPKLEKWAKSIEDEEIRDAIAIFKNPKTKKNMSEFLAKAFELAKNHSQSKYQIRMNVQYLSRSSSDGLGKILELTNNKLAKLQKESLELFKKMGLILISLCLLQVILVWPLVFRPLYKTVLTQHEKIIESILKAESASRSKTDFLANISHEIRTPMTAILGYADILRRDNVSKEEKEDAVKIIDQNASHLMGLIDEILDISKIESGKFELKKEKVDLSVLLNEVYSLINVKSEDKGIHLRFKNAGQIPQTVFTDPKRLKQILFNILGNAIKFTEKGSVELTVSYSHELNKLFLIVEDTGIGIPSKQIQKLFRPFEQADTSVARKFGGTGLGLVLSRNLAQAMGGNVSIVNSRLKVGTTVEITIDVGEVENLELLNSLSTNVIEEDVSNTDIPSLKGINILVVDDAKENARLFQLYLKNAGAEVQIANEGNDAIARSKSFNFDLILLDLQMPGKDGFQVIKELRSIGFSKPVLALTAHAMQEEKNKTKIAGFNAHITKPVRADHLIHTIRKFIS